MHSTTYTPNNIADSGEISFVEYCGALLKRWRLIAVFVVVAAVLSVATALLLTPKYSAEAVVIEKDNAATGSSSAAMLAKLGSLASIAGIDLGTLGGKADDARATLHSRALLMRFIKEHNLLPLLFPNKWDAGRQQWTSAPEDTPSLWWGAKYFSENVFSIKEDLTLGSISIQIEWHDPMQAAVWANGLVRLADEMVRTRALGTAQRNASYLQQELSKTNLVGLQQVLYGLLESEMQTIMLANGREQYAFSIIDPAVEPELHSFPNRPLLAIAGTLFGGFIAAMIVLIQLILSRQPRR